jgi:DNA-binding MarR family transcriptional regulator
VSAPPPPGRPESLADAPIPRAVASRPDGCEDYESPIVGKLFELHHMMMRVGDRMASRHGLTSSRWMFLCAIGKSDEPSTINQIAERVNLSPQNTSRTVAAMEEDGLVCRFNLPGCGRSTFAGLTDAGWDAYATTKQLAAAFCPPFLEGFSDSRTDRLERDLAKLIENIARLESALIADPGSVMTNTNDGAKA